MNHGKPGAAERSASSEISGEIHGRTGKEGRGLTFGKATDSKEYLPMQETQVQFQGQEDPLEKETASHSSILAWRIPWTEEPGGL